MAIKVGLSVYRFELREKTARDWWTFALGSNTDGYKAVDLYLRARFKRLQRLGDQATDGTYADQRAVLLLKIARNEDTRMLAGNLLKGEAGAIREIRDFDDPESEPSYRTKVNEGILTPIYFRYHIPDGRKYGVAMLQTLGIDAAKGYVDSDLRRYFKDEAATPLTHKLTQLVDIKVLERFARDGQLQDVVLINSGKSEESRKAMEKTTVAGDSLGNAGDKLALRLHRRDGWPAEVLKEIYRAIRDKKDPRELVDVPAMDHIDDLHVEITQGGKTQTFSLLNPDDSPIRYDITNEVAIGPDGYPQWVSIHRAADTVWQSVQGMLNGRA